MKKNFNFKNKRKKIYQKKLIKVIEVNVNDYKIEFLDKEYYKKYPKFCSVKYEGNIVLNEGDIIKAKIQEMQDNKIFMHSVIFIEKGPFIFFGLVTIENKKLTLISINKNISQKFLIINFEKYKNKVGFLVKAEEIKHYRYTQNRHAKIIEILKEFKNSDIPIVDLAINQYKLKKDFSNEIINEVEKIKKFEKADFLKTHKDLTKIPFLTIDPENAQDHDDAVFASFSDKKNKKEFIIFVSIADVSFYVKENSLIDLEALKRGNSTYFPKDVIHMLPEKLSNDLCSLKKNTLRPCITVKILIDDNGKVNDYDIFRSIIKVRDNLSYEKVNEILTNPKHNSPHNALINDIYRAYLCLKKQTDNRNPLNLFSEEKEIFFKNKDEIKSIGIKKNIITHKIIEDMMILANNCVAKKLSKTDKKIIFRIHESPDKTKLKILKDFFNSLKINVPKINDFKPVEFNKLVENLPNNELKKIINNSILRTMKQAKYSIKNIGHYGLNLEHYVHFTSPIRRYSDLYIHRILIEVINKKTLNFHQLNLIENICYKTSKTERISAKAERETTERYIAKYMQKKIGEVFSCYISEIKTNGIWIRLNDVPCESFIPKKNLDYEDLFYDKKNFILSTYSRKIIFSLGDKLNVKLIESFPLSGSLIFKFLNHEAIKN